MFDRTWYGRRLVEQVEGYCSEAEWLRAYGEINDFEAGLTDCGLVVVKFWLAISKDEQARRFEARAKVPFAQCKITDEDRRNRERWEQSVDASATWWTGPAPPRRPGPWGGRGGQALRAAQGARDDL